MPAEHEAPLRAQYFVDPICSWSWGNEPHLRKFLTEYGPHLHLRHRMGGLMARRGTGFFDPQVGLGGEDPAAYAAHQSEVCDETGMPFDPRVWSEHPPISSHPACIAVKAAQLQDEALGAAYLRRVQEGFFTECMAVDDRETLAELAARVPVLDPARLMADMDGPAKAAFEEDFELARRPVPEARDTKETEGRMRYAFPTLILANAEGERWVIDAGHPYGAYREAAAALAPEVAPARPPDVGAFLASWGSATTREAAMVCEVTEAEAEMALEALARDGQAVARAAGSGSLWVWRPAGVPA